MNDARAIYRANHRSRAEVASLTTQRSSLLDTDLSCKQHQAGTYSMWLVSRNLWFGTAKMPFRRRIKRSVAEWQAASLYAIRWAWTRPAVPYRHEVFAGGRHRICTVYSRGVLSSLRFKVDAMTPYYHGGHPCRKDCKELDSHFNSWYADVTGSFSRSLCTRDCDMIVAPGCPIGSIIVLE